MVFGPKLQIISKYFEYYNYFKMKKNNDTIMEKTIENLKIPEG